jgi:toluene monooxygenase system protein B
MAPLPITATFEGDIVTLAVLVDDEDTVDVVAAKIARHAVGRRVAASEAPVKLRVADRVLEQDQVVRTVPLSPLTHVVAFFDE